MANHEYIKKLRQHWIGPSRYPSHLSGPLGMQWSKGGLLMPSPRPHFGNRILTVAATWGVLALVALLAGPVPAMLLSLIPLGLALRAVLQAHAQRRQPTMEQMLQRQVTVAAMLIAVGLFTATLWSLRDRVPLWAIPMEVGMLLHYWLLTLRLP
jgi:hypothetical protein